MKIQTIPLLGISDPAIRDALDVLQRNIGALTSAVTALQDETKALRQLVNTKQSVQTAPTP